MRALTGSCSGGQIQIDWVGTYNENDSVQSDSVKSISGCDRLLKRSNRIESF